MEKTLGAVVAGLICLDIIPEIQTLPEWKLMQSGTYVVGLESSNCRVEGRAAERASGRLQFLKPREVRRYAIEVEFFEPRRGAQ